MLENRFPACQETLQRLVDATVTLTTVFNERNSDVRKDEFAITGAVTSSPSARRQNTRRNTNPKKQIAQFPIPLRRTCRNYLSAHVTVCLTGCAVRSLFNDSGANKYKRRLATCDRLFFKTPRLGRSYVLRLPPLRSFCDFKLHFLAFLQALEAASLDSREVYENIFASLAADKTVAFGVVKPLCCSLFHVTDSFQSIFTLERSRR